MKEVVKIEVRDRVESLSSSGQAGLVFAEGIEFARWKEAAAFAARARTTLVAPSEAEAAAHALGAQVALDGRGLIGAVAAVGAAEMGPEAADVARA
jgi:tRNA(Ile2) C34 agmatinyltransferase TiaS